jgi:hypothetical protein
VNNITLEDVDRIFLAGRVVAVTYVDRDLTADVIGEAEGNLRGATHALCCMGGLDIIEATAFGVAETNLKNYLKGNCILTVREAIPQPSEWTAKHATYFWNDRVLDPYDWGMIFGTLPVVIVRHTIGLFSRGLSDYICQRMPNLLASSSLSTCAELAVRGLRKFYQGALGNFSLGEIEPEDLRIDSSLNTVAVLVSPVFVEA